MRRRAAALGERIRVEDGVARAVAAKIRQRPGIAVARDPAFLLAHCQLASAHDFDVPPSMVDAEYENIMAQLRHEASHEADPEAVAAAVLEPAGDREGPHRRGATPDRIVSLFPRSGLVGAQFGVVLVPADSVVSDHGITRSPDHPIARSPGRPIARWSPPRSWR